MRSSVAFLLLSMAVIVGLSLPTAQHHGAWGILAVSPALLLAYVLGILLERYWG